MVQNSKIFSLKSTKNFYLGFLVESTLLMLFLRENLEKNAVKIQKT
jgi:hypothetical protein